METMNDVAAEVLAQIRDGHLDGDLVALERELRLRREAVALDRASEFSAGDTVVLTAPISPKYLIGQTAMVQKVNRKSVVLSFGDDPALRRFAGQSQVRCPISCVTSA